MLEMTKTLQFSGNGAQTLEFGARLRMEQGGAACVFGALTSLCGFVCVCSSGCT